AGDEANVCSVRRASGGTAVLHCGQVGYAAILSSDDPIWEGDLAASYYRFGAALRDALADLGVESALADASAAGRFTAARHPDAAKVCFARLGPHELLVDGRKVG